MNLLEDKFTNKVRSASNHHDKIISDAEGKAHLKAELSRIDSRNINRILDSKVRPIYKDYEKLLQKQGHECKITNNDGSITISFFLKNLRSKEEGFPKFTVFYFQGKYCLYGTLHAGEDYAGDITIMQEYFFENELNDDLIRENITKLLVESYNDPSEFSNLP